MHMHLAQHRVKVAICTAATELNAESAEVGKPAATQDNKQCSGRRRQKQGMHADAGVFQALGMDVCHSRFFHNQQ